MRTAAQETLPQRNCSKDVAGKVRIYVILGKGEYMQSSRHFPESCLKPREAFCWSQETIVSMKDFSAFLRYEVKQEPGS